jgi:hypothetical protein
MADPYGFEPEIAESKSAVLPLHQGSIKWSAVQDSNLRPFAPKANALPGCANGRYTNLYYTYKVSTKNGCPGRDRTYDQVINSHLLCR